MVSVNILNVQEVMLPKIIFVFFEFNNNYFSKDINCDFARSLRNLKYILWVSRLKFICLCIKKAYISCFVSYSWGPATISRSISLLYTMSLITLYSGSYDPIPSLLLPLTKGNGNQCYFLFSYNFQKSKTISQCNYIQKLYWNVIIKTLLY